MRRNWMAAMVVSCSLVGSAALADWEAPVVLAGEDDWESPVTFTAEDDWEAPSALSAGASAEDDWESPVILTGGGRESSACLQAMVMKWQPRGSSGPVYLHGFWDACGQDGASGWQSYELIDAAWWDSYVSAEAGRSIFRTRVVQDAAGWHGQLYNFRLGAWEKKAFTAR